MNNLDRNGVQPGEIHRQAVALLNPVDQQSIQVHYDIEGRRQSSDAKLTSGEFQLVDRYEKIRALLEQTHGRPMPLPNPPRVVSSKPPQRIKFDEFTPRFEQALLACLMRSSKEFDLTLLRAGCFTGTALFTVAWQFFKFLKENSSGPSWIALEQLVTDETRKRNVEQLDDVTALLGEIQGIDADNEMPFVVSRYHAWAKHQLIKQSLSNFAEKLEESEDERNDAWNALEDSWHYDEEAFLEDGHALIHTALERPEEVVEGVLYKGHKLMFGGSSKSFKTFTLLDLAVSVAGGRNWWGFATKRGQVLYVNFEIDRPFFKQRLEAITKAKGVELEEGWFTHVYLRGDIRTAETLLQALKQRIRGQDYVLVIFDPLYRMLGGRNENAASEIASLLNLFSQFAEETGAAIAYGNHFSKGN